jgi:hypothetical protein
VRRAEAVTSRLSDAPGRTMHMNALAAITSTSQSRLSHAVARLADLGWFERSRCPANMRAVHAALTERPVIEGDGTCVGLISCAAGGLTGPALNHWPVTAAVLTLEPGRSLEHVLPARDRAFFTALSGQVAIAGPALGEGQTAWSDPAAG